MRNPLIANTLYLSSDIERWGSGLKRIYEACQAENIKIEFKKLKSGFLVIFYRPEKKLGVGGVERGVVKGVEKGVARLSAKERIIFNLIKEDSYITKAEIMTKGNLSKKAVEYNIIKLKRKGLLERIGPDKGGHWALLEPKE